MSHTSVGPNDPQGVIMGLKANFETWRAIFQRSFSVWKLVEKEMFWHIIENVVSL